MPGSSAGDAAPTQAIPRIAKPVTDKKPPVKKAPASTPPSPAKNQSPARNGVPVAGQTDKGRPRATSAPAASGSDTQRQVRPTSGPTGRPLTTADYAHTTKGSPATTSVIPAVKDVPRDSRPATAPPQAPAAGSGRRASLRLTHIEPWSVTRLAFAISVAMMIVAVVAVTIFWIVLEVAGVWDQINDSFTTVLSDDSASFNVTDYFGLGRVVGLTLVLSAVNVVLMTALATIGAHLYNLAAQLMGGVELTFAEDK
ncbi:DUF3566 domain-containing protein [Aeromicrobium wangtongii]|uniref:DUF3566 domain-containing protein n=1 Tax=Aeromicrobium wangtongii TaxID=2969247 RepID=UPI0020178D14|nr:DUF3566 domain-containing protein [Aeromicrobium wangtongii]MCL3817141.1 DUF3566 domain-containing protein [Aeromicrobium wangtongii]